jgi:hypothetical protein
MPRKTVVKQRMCGLACFIVLCFFYQDVLEIQLLWLQDAQAMPSHSKSRVVVSMTSFSERIMVTGMYAISSVIFQMEYYDRFLISIPLRAVRGPEKGEAMCKFFRGCIEIDAMLNSTEADILLFLERQLGQFVALQNRTYENAKYRVTVQF